ncbi:acyl transferase/acyl hydrolase/lysophospholipase [Stachybotrys elegans]|uniref:Lysophospholipase n=1 Tax=Stachybotrys elegans TaxID=80388 RepID=A0A8K0SXI4_9HYPO|nr:acyl transferase/acyl hydrolase/lysophospholipase [Stachybotrys elegans]
MRRLTDPFRSLMLLRARLPARRRTSAISKPQFRGFFTRGDTNPVRSPAPSSSVPLALVTGGIFIWLLYPSDEFARLSRDEKRSKAHLRQHDASQGDAADNDQQPNQPAWTKFASRFELFTSMSDVQWSLLSDKLVDYILPEWSKTLPSYIKKLQREMSMSPGSLADEIWQEAQDPTINPEIQYAAQVRVSEELCEEEREYLARRRRITQAALARYLDIEEKDIHPDDIPTIAVCGSGGGLRALIAGTGSLLAADRDGLFDCVTYTSGVSGSCWLQALYLSSFNNGSLGSLLEHLKSRASIHIAYPPVAFNALISLPTSKYILSGLVEKLKGDPNADFGLVDVYGLLLAARYLVPKGELGVNERDFKISNQRDQIKYGQHPLPIYTAVRHEIPEAEIAESDKQSSPSEVGKAGDEICEAWFQWFEITPYEFFCEELGAGIPTWALGRRFNRGVDVLPDHGYHLPELRLPLMLGIFGSAFCATLSHYYREIRPIVRKISGLDTVDQVISGRDDDLSKVHPIEPARIPNFAYQMQGMLPPTTPPSILQNEYIQLMDAGMSNNLPIYPLLRPGRNVDIVVAFDASADVKTDNWISVVEGYTKQRGIKGWPVGIGWPKPGEPVTKVRKELEAAEADTESEVERKLGIAKRKQEEARRRQGSQETKASGADGEKAEKERAFSPGNEETGDLGYCTVWVGSIEERSSDPRAPSKAIAHDDSWRLTEPDAGIAVVYLPFLSNDKVPGISPGTTDFLSTWNFVYTADQIDDVVRLAQANYEEGKQQIRSTVRAVYERKKKLRLDAEKQLRMEKYRDIASRGEENLRGEGDLFS